MRVLCRMGLVGVAAAGCLLGGACNSPSDPPIPVTLPPLPDPPDEAFRVAPPSAGPRADFMPPAVDHFKLASGVDVVLVERHALPMVNWSLEFPAGDVTDPTGKEGRAALCMYLLVQGGASDSADLLADMGSTIVTRGGLETGQLDGFTLRDNLDATLDQWKAVLSLPGMDQESLDFGRQRKQAAMLQTSADPASVVWRVLQIAARGEHHPYARLPTANSYANVTLNDCGQFFSDFLQPDGAHLYVAGDITHEEVVQKFDGRLLRDGAGHLPGPLIPNAEPDNAAVTFVNMPGAVQAEILMWGRAPALTAADYSAASTMLSIFAGNSITSRLGNDLREMMGTTYSVRGALTSWKADALLTVMVPVQTDKAGAAIMAILADAAIMRATDVTDDELSLVRDGAIASLPFQFITGLQTVNAFRGLVYFDLPFTYFQDLPGRLAAVDKVAIRAAAGEYLAPEGLHFVVVGDATNVLPTLMSLTAPDGAFPGALRTVDTEGHPVHLP